MNPLHAYLGLLALFAVERGAELWLSRRNARRSLARGALEAGRGHYPAMVVVHALFLAACAAEALAWPEAPHAVALLALAGALGAQALRWWAVSALGDRWSTRILVVPGEPPVTSGPYRWLRHPNYLAVVLEVACLPLAYGSWRTALAFSILNGLLLRARIPAEERALGAAWEASLGDRPRLVPGLRAGPPAPPARTGSGAPAGRGAP